ncbi:MAG: FAD-linked oxidase C-terminal domain-containing protein [Caldilineaceae bacterium]
MTAMYSGAELAAMVAVKDAFDPNNLCNPGKVLPRTCRPRPCPTRRNRR